MFPKENRRFLFIKTGTNYSWTLFGSRNGEGMSVKWRNSTSSITINSHSLWIEANWRDFYAETQPYAESSHWPTAATVTRQIIFDWNSFVNGRGKKEEQTTTFVTSMRMKNEAVSIWQSGEWAWKVTNYKKQITKPNLKNIDRTEHRIFTLKYV